MNLTQLFHHYYPPSYKPAQRTLEVHGRDSPQVFVILSSCAEVQIPFSGLSRPHLGRLLVLLLDQFPEAEAMGGGEWDEVGGRNKPHLEARRWEEDLLPSL